MSQPPDIPEMVGKDPRGSGGWAWLRRNKVATAAFIGAFLAAAVVGVLLLPSLDEEASSPEARALMLGEMERWKAPKIERGDPRALIRGTDLAAGAEGGGQPLDDDAGAALGGRGPARAQDGEDESSAKAADGPPEGAGARRFGSGKTLAALKRQDKTPGVRGGGGVLASGTRGAAATARAADPARGPIARARRRLSAAFRGVSRAAGSALAGLRRAFGGSASDRPYAASGGPSAFSSAQGPGGGAAGPIGGGIGDMGGAGSDSTGGGGGGATALAKLKGAGPAKEVNPSGAKDVKCKALAAAAPDFWIAYNESRNINARYHSTGTEDKDLLVPLMGKLIAKYAELDKQNAELLGRLGALNLSCKSCRPVETCREFVQLSIGTGNGGGIAREIQDVVRDAQKGLGVCAHRGYEDQGAAAECMATGLSAVDHDHKAETMVEQHLVLVNAKQPECRAKEDVGTPEERAEAKRANEAWTAYVRADLEAYRKVYDFLKTPWCEGDRPPCAPIRLGKMRDAWQRMGKLEASAAAISGFLEGAPDYAGKMAEARRAMRQAIVYHEDTFTPGGGDDRSVFLGVGAEDEAADLMNSLGEAFDQAMSKCGLSRPAE
ncbi:MAG: hypothetical protein HY553_13840 [Elusimicrobia bacterium]|nr:hypothetical protein [Elusimicrobiota bacterium]